MTSFIQHDKEQEIWNVNKDFIAAIKHQDQACLFRNLDRVL